uniref:Uncharacterized protein n=1 Tax=Vannella robusta TaxID=1487602 RepID=A0A7S4HJE4_9EUKA|mmetsp:Transcript_11503/g.14241  ORF Transcript_11503/g.14241 Transcript_11503/m.14241 type:complete len:135 (+) Transcript_11503:210-614(+)|eukprot:CAMPEP_0206203978 /NCGR_PEP_ID=MMETSP0166-20121206/13222_1 /ASSEMBLY_ACC=CAM_ASM_000260 /TAXON_ID=95228 /ORGANISM="Vannella robusta, Strain DIVA3 518/3/11/1/6" /LENGTH=134 /DNA_ID=CAMNT_0053623461 /DNA_START=124 /DNA_END=528 /DNA_ORIENTATION=-
MKIKPQLDQLGVRLVAVGTGSKLFAKKFKEGVPFDGEVFLDPEAKTFKAIDLPRLSIWQVTKRFLLNLTAISFYRQISSNYPQSDTKGDGQQTGGVFVVGPGVGEELLFSFRENDAEVEEFASHDDIIAAASKE